MRLASPLSFRPLEKICADAPEKKGPTPLCSPRLFGVCGGADNVSAGRRAAGPVRQTPRVFSGELKCGARNAKKLFFGVCSEGVLDAQDDVGARAAAGRLLQEVPAL